MVGRPLKYTLEEVKQRMEKYFDSITDSEDSKWLRPPTITGLARSIGMSRMSLLDYQAKDEFADTIKEAKYIVEEYVEESLFIGKNQTGTIFSLKNNFKGWKDRTEVENHNHTYGEYLDGVKDE